MKTFSTLSLSLSPLLASLLVLALSGCGDGSRIGAGGDGSATNGASAPIASSAPSVPNAPDATSNTTPIPASDTTSIDPTNATRPTDDAPASSTPATSTPTNSTPTNSTPTTSTPAAPPVLASNPTVTPTPAAPITCSIASNTSAASGGDLVSADTPSADGTRLFASGSTFRLALTSRATSNDTLDWSIADHIGHAVAHGSFAVPASASTTTLDCVSTAAGYFAVSATLAQGGGTLPQTGTRPRGIASFGIVPNLAGIVPTPAYAKQEQHRFGMQGANDNAPLLSALGIGSTFDNRQLSQMEPTGPNQFNPAADNLDPFYKSGDVMRLVRLDGISAWASSTNAAQDDTNPPNDFTYYTNYMLRVGIETASIRARYFPQQTQNFYQVTWTPDYFWNDTDANFVAMYRSVWLGLHTGDPNAVVMGSADTIIGLTTRRLQRLAPLGFAQWIDGVATQGYYDAGTSPSHPPERLDFAADAATVATSLRNQLRGLRAEMAADYRPGMKLFATELGIGYDDGAQYGPNYPSANILFAQGAVLARSHIITLGEGADQTYVSYGADRPDEIGSGTFFNLDNTQGSFGPSQMSPKPAAMAVSAMTRILDGTVTLGALNGVPAGIYAYAFQPRGSSTVITALWAHSNAVWNASSGFSASYGVPYALTVDAAGTSGTVSIIDVMGNAQTLGYTNGVVSLHLGESPVYVVSANASAMQANVTTPVGYTGN